MPLKYTGRADTYVYGGKAYRPGDVVPISPAEAARESARTHLHSFEPVSGATAPAETAPEPKKP